MKQFLRYTLTLVVVLLTTTPAWAQAQNLQYQWVTRFDNTITFDNADLQKITNGAYVEHVKFTITDVSYYHENKLIGDDVDRLDYTTYKDANEHQSTWSWEVEQNPQNKYRLTVTDIKCQVRGKNSDSNESAYAWFNNNSKVDCKTKSGDEGGSKEVGISNANGLGNSVIFKRQGYYKKSSYSNWAEDYVTFTLHNIRYTCKVEQQVPIFQYKAEAQTSNSEYGAAYSSWESFTNATSSTSTSTSYSANKYLPSEGMTKKVYFKAVAKPGYTFVGWKESANATTYLSYDEEYSFDFTSTSNDLEAPSTIKRYAVFMGKQQPQLSGPATGATKVGNIDDLIFTFINTSNAPIEDDSKDFYFSIKHNPDNTTKAGSANPNLVISYDPINKKVTGLNSGTATITFVQKETSTHYTDTLRCTVTVTKQATNFELNFANEYFVDDEINKSTFFTNATNSEVAIQVSDKTADNRALFTYNGSILKANGATLNADAETTTITVTQPENYKWTSCTQEKNVTVKKHQTNFAWNDGESLECYVDDQTDITNLYTKASDNTLPVNFNIEVVERGYGNTDVVSIENGVLTAIGEGKVVVTASQAVDRKWTDFSTPITINVKRYDVSATLNPTTTVWNATHSNPFSVSISPANGETITDFSVGESSNSAIATYNANSKTIQTYYTSGSADFQVTRPEDRKYNALNQTLTLTVNANENGCTLFSDPTHYKIGMYENSNGVDFTLPGIGDVLTFQLWKNTAATQDVHVYGYNAAGTQVLDKKYENSSITTNENNPNNCSVQLSEDIVKIKIKAGGTLNKHFKNLNITRAQYIRPTDAGQPLNSTNALVLPPVAINLPRSKPFNLEWSACSDIKITCDNPKFTISTTDISAVSGSQNITITCNTSEIGTFIGDVTIYNQEQKETFPVICEVYTKWLTDSISGSATHSMKVDEPWDTDFYFPIQRASQYPTTDGAFHYAIKHTFVDENQADRNPNHPNEVISYNNGVITAHNAGTAILTIKHDETDEHFESQQFTCTLTVSKHDVKLQWKDPVYFNDTISNYFTTSNITSPIVIESQTDIDVATLTNEFNPTSNNSLDLITFNKEASTTVTVSQAENYKWNGYSKEHTITPIDPNNHVTFTIDSENEMRYVFYNSHNSPILEWENGIQVGDWSDGFNYNDKTVTIHFSGIPDSLSFNTSIKEASVITPATDIKWYVKESIDGTNWSGEIWNNKGTRNLSPKIKLNPDTRYIMLCYSGNFGAIFHDITVTELNEFRAVDQNNDTQDVTHLDFGANQVFTSKTLPFKLRYANPGYKITVESTDPHFTVDPSYIGDIGGENHGTRTINVTYTSSEPYATSSNAMIIIKDEIGNEHSDTVYLSASSYKAEQVIHWRDDFEKIPQPIIRRKNGEITDAAWATSHLPVTFTSNNEAVIKISDDGKTLIPIAEGEAEITAYQLGNETWLPADDTTKTFIVTEKLLQYIIWDDDLTNIIKEDITPQTLPLTAQVYLQKEDGTVVFSQEQTNNLKYQSGNDHIVSAVGSTLTINNVGNTTLTATVNGNDDYATASMTKTVIVRSATPGCDDNLLYHHEGDPIQFFQYNMDEIIKEPIALDRSKGEAGYVVVSHYGQSWNLAIQYYAAEIRVEQSLDNCSTWSIIETIRPVKNQENFDTIPLSRQATHIRFVRNYGGQGYQFLYNIDVHPAQYIEAQDVVDFGEIHVGSRETRTFPLHYSNIKQSLSPVPSTSEVTATPNTFGECSGFGTQDISVTWLPTQVSDNATATITFTDPNSGMEKIVTLVAKVTKGTQNIIWDNIPNIIEDCGSILFPEKTTADLPIKWTVIQGKEYADFNEQGMLEIYKNGTIKVQAIQEGTANYEPLTPAQYTYTFNIQLQTIFVGTEDSNWDNPNNWTMCRLPYPTEVVTIEHPATLSTHATVAGVIFSTNGSIHITHTGGLTINEDGVTNAATNGSSITIDNNPQGAGFLLISPSAPEANKYPYFTMNFTTRAFNEGVPRDETWQYMGAPGNNATFKNLDSQTLIYHWDETKGWTPYTVNGSLPTWQGFALTQSTQDNQTYQITAQAIQGTKTIDLTYTASGMKGDNLFVNSFTAPIDITKFTKDDITDNWGYQTFYFFNTGSWNDWQGNNPHSHDDKSSAGHYYAVPLFSAPYLEGSQTIVPPMQGVYVHTEEPDVSITLDYVKHVWNGAAGNLPMRAPHKQSPDFQRVRIQVSSEHSGADRMYIIQEPSTTRDYDNGYDGKNINAQGQVNIYTNEPFGKMEVSCANNIDSMYIGLRTGNDTHYTLTFGAIAGDSLYLQDLENDSIIPLINNEQYHFTAQPNTVNNSRFLLLSHPRFAPNTSTPTTDINGDTLAKIWSIGSTIYIANAPAYSWATLYTVSGHLVLSTPIANTQSPATLDVSHLPQGVYILRLNNQVYKFVCK